MKLEIMEVLPTAWSPMKTSLYLRSALVDALAAAMRPARRAVARRENQFARRRFEFCFSVQAFRQVQADSIPFNFPEVLASARIHPRPKVGADSFACPSRAHAPLRARVSG